MKLYKKKVKKNWLDILLDHWAFKPRLSSIEQNSGISIIVFKKEFGIVEE